MVAKSRDGGLNWTQLTIDFQLLPANDYGGCEASLASVDRSLFYIGSIGGPGSKDFEDRQNLGLYKREKNGSWNDVHILYPLAAGYSSSAIDKNGNLFIAFETADTPGFPKLLPNLRKAGWMRIDLMMMPNTYLRRIK